MAILEIRLKEFLLIFIEIIENMLTLKGNSSNKGIQEDKGNSVTSAISHSDTLEKISRKLDNVKTKKIQKNKLVHIIDQEDSIITTDIEKVCLGFKLQFNNKEIILEEKLEISISLINEFIRINLIIFMKNTINREIDMKT